MTSVHRVINYAENHCPVENINVIHFVIMVNVIRAIKKDNVNVDVAKR